MRKNGSSEHHQDNNFKVMIEFGNFLDSEKSFRDVETKQQVLAFLDTKIKTFEIDPDKKWITTWNNYLNRIKLFCRWLFNHSKETETEDWQTPKLLLSKIVN